MSSDRPAAAVVIPTRNRLVLLREAVASVVRQSTNDWEALVVDDAGTDGTAEWLASPPDPRVRLVRSERHVERSAARNLGLAQARAPAVLFLDDDDELLPEALADLAGLLRSHPSAAAAVGHVEVATQHGVHRGPRPRFISERVPWREVIAGWRPLQGQALFRRDALLEIGGYSSGLTRSEDVDLWLRLCHLPVVVGTRRVLRVRSHAGQATRDAPDGYPGELEMRAAFVERMAAARRRAARIALEFWKETRAAWAREGTGDATGFRNHMLKAWRRAPTLALSPLMRGEFAYHLGKSCVPPALRVGLNRLLGRPTHPPS